MEAEGRTLRRKVLRVGVALTLLLVIGVTVLGGLGFCFAAAYLALAAVLPHSIAALLVGVGMFVIAVTLVWITAIFSR